MLAHVRAQTASAPLSSISQDWFCFFLTASDRCDSNQRRRMRMKEALVTVLTGLLPGVLWCEQISTSPACRLLAILAEADLDKNTATAIRHTRRWLEQWGACSFDIKKYLATHLLITSEPRLKAKAINQVNYVLVPPLSSAESKSCGTREGAQCYLAPTLALRVTLVRYRSAGGLSVCLRSRGQPLRDAPPLPHSLQHLLFGFALGTGKKIDTQLLFRVKYGSYFFNEG